MSESSLTEIRHQSVSNSRFKLLDRPIAIPGKCVVCGAVDRPVVDTGWNIDYYGVVYFCISCLTEVATVIGMIDGKDAQEAELDSTRQFYTYLNEHDLKVVSNGQYLSWLSHISRLHADFTNSEHIDSLLLDAETASTESTADETISRVVEQEPEPIIDEGLLSLSSSNSDGNTFDFS